VGRDAGDEEGISFFLSNIEGIIDKKEEIKGVKKFISIVFLLVLAACSGQQNELDNFVKAYNGNVDGSLNTIDKNEIDEIREEENGKWQQIVKEDGKYTIEAKYDKDNNISGYHIGIDGTELYETMKGEGFKASTAIIKALDLDSDKYIDGYVQAMENGEYSYEDGAYSISFSDMVIADDHTGLYINFDKASQ
jgi:hypothetical protein